MSLTEQIGKDLATAMKEKDAVRLGALRLIKNELKKQEIDQRGPLDDGAAIKVLEKMCKQRRDSIEQFEKASRQDLVDKERSELSVIESYMPSAPTEDEIRAVVAEAVRESGATSAAQMGNVMKAVMAKLKGKPVDGKLVSSLVKAALG